MKAAIYCRKSTGQNVADDAKSVVRQEANARAFAAKQGWTVTHVFKDDGVRGADARRLVQRQRMIELIQSGCCPFDVVVMRAQDRFSRRDGHVAFAELEQLAQHVDVWFYEDGSRFASGTLESNMTGILKGEFGAEFRRAIARKTHEAMRRRAELGYVTGNRVLEYDNVPASNGFKDRAINAAEAKVVREIYQRFADGEGLKAISHELNRRKLPAPRAQRRKAA